MSIPALIHNDTHATHLLSLDLSDQATIEATAGITVNGTPTWSSEGVLFPTSSDYIDIDLTTVIPSGYLGLGDSGQVVIELPKAITPSHNKGRRLTWCSYPRQSEHKVHIRNQPHS